MKQSTDTIIVALVILAGVTMASVLAAGVLVTEPTAVIASIIGISSPVMLGLLGVLINSLTKHINSRMDDLLSLTRSASFAEGKASGIETERENPMVGSE